MTEHEEQERERVARLVTALLEETITPAEMRELQDILATSQSAQHHYVELMQDINSLHWWSGTTDPVTPVATVERSAVPRRAAGLSRRRVLGIVGAAAACVAIVVGVSSFRKPDVEPVVARPVDGGGAAAALLQSDPSIDSEPILFAGRRELTGVATILRSKGVHWGGDTLPLKEMSRLSLGRTVELAEGEVEIAFDRAVHMVVRGPARFVVRAELEVYSQFGTLSARVGELGKGFVIETPSGRITDLGTEFGVAIDRAGKTDVAVFRGAVDLTYGDRESPIKPSIARTLTQGQALTLNTDGSMYPLFTIDNDRFPHLSELIPPPAPRSTVFGEISENRRGLDVTFYRIVPGGLREDAPAYVDRQHEWNGVDEQGIPEPLLGADYIMPFNADKYHKDLELSVEILRPATLYIFLSSRAREPEWLEKLATKTDMVIGLDESGEYSRAGYELAVGPGNGVDTVFSVWECKVTRPGKIKLGSVQQKMAGWGFCMYGLAAVPLDTP
jgi:hypothetical protein